MKICSLYWLLFLVIDVALGTRIAGRILKPNSQPLASTRVSLSGGIYSSLSKSDGTFAFHDVAPGVYLLDVLSVPYSFSQMKIKIENDEVSVVEYEYPGGPKKSVDQYITLQAHGEYGFFEIHQPFNVMSLLSNPMVYMVLFMLGMAFIMPKMMANVDPEEMKKMQAGQKDPNELLKQLFGGGKSDNKEDDD